MKKVFVVYVEQEFDALRYSNKKWYKPLELEKYRETVVLNHSDKYILAQSEEEAIEKYKETKAYKNRYNTCSIDWWEFGGKNFLPKGDLNITVKFCVYESIASIDKLKEKLTHNDFFELCRQEMYPIEVVMK